MRLAQKMCIFLLATFLKCPLVCALSAVLHADLPNRVFWVDVYREPSNTLIMTAPKPYVTTTGDILQWGSLLQFLWAVVVVVLVYKSVLIFPSLQIEGLRRLTEAQRKALNASGFTVTWRCREAFKNAIIPRHCYQEKRLHITFGHKRYWETAERAQRLCLVHLIRAFVI